MVKLNLISRPLACTGKQARYIDLFKPSFDLRLNWNSSEAAFGTKGTIDKASYRGFGAGVEVMRLAPSIALVRH